MSLVGSRLYFVTFSMPSVAENRKIVRAAKADSDASPLTDKQLKEMVPLRTLRGRPKSASKKLLVSIRYSPDVLSYFKSAGEGWQARMDAVLQDYGAKENATLG
jgi:uncharacterized protein (DUF4415 family)